MGEAILYEPSLIFAEEMDRKDPLRKFREAFLFPRHEDRDCLYFCGNSLGLQPRRVGSYLQEELARWAMLGVEGHFKGELPWTRFHRALAPASAHVVGALESEVIVMNTLTVNLHLMMVSFYRPRGGRFKIMMEAGAFPSDQYAVESQLRWHGLDPEEALVELAPRPGEECLRDEDILSAIGEHGDSLALVLFGGLNYYTGQLYDMAAITQAAHRTGAIAGFDLAHAAGNVPLHLHDWGVDFAVWCTYKYMNSGPGALSGAFIHERYAFNTEIPRLAGWWGYDEKRRFKMEKGFVPNPGAEGWQLSNAPILAFAPMRASHELFLQAGMEAIRQKSVLLTGYLEFLIDDLNKNGSTLQLITPRNPAQRGAQLSLLTGPEGKQLFEHLARQGVVCDWREHNLPTQDATGSKAGVIRLAPAPLYNSFSDVFKLSRIIKNFALSPV
ncbi:MAG: kynureninase [Saprospiraceae bacterium]